MRRSSAALLLGRFGAKPPSSPTPVASPFSFSSPLSVWKTSEATRRADEKFSRSEEHTSELQSQSNLVCRLLLEKKKKNYHTKKRDARIRSMTNVHKSMTESN